MKFPKDLMFKNIRPVKSSEIPWGWTNATLGDYTFVREHTGYVPDISLVDHYDWLKYELSESFNGLDVKDSVGLGSRDNKSILTTTWRFLGNEMYYKFADGTIGEDLQKVSDMFFGWNKELLKHVGNWLDFFFIGDDVAYNNGLLISPDHWRTFVKPHLKRLIDLAKQHGIVVIYHSDGDLTEILDDLCLDLSIPYIDGENVGRMKDHIDKRFYGNSVIFENYEVHSNVSY